MPAIVTAPPSQTEKKAEQKGKALPPLENGDRLHAGEFLRRYEAMPDVKKAELIQGIVYMASPVRVTHHGEPDGIIQSWLGNYSAMSDGVRHAINSTAKLGPDDVPQPDGMLWRIDGQATVDEDDYLSGPPELVVEIASSSVSCDAGIKRDSYRLRGCARIPSVESR